MSWNGQELSLSRLTKAEGPVFGFGSHDDSQRQLRPSARLVLRLALAGPFPQELCDSELFLQRQNRLGHKGPVVTEFRAEERLEALLMICNYNLQKLAFEVFRAQSQNSIASLLHFARQPHGWHHSQFVSEQSCLLIQRNVIFHEQFAEIANSFTSAIRLGEFAQSNFRKIARESLR
jgi:hypothetical protein